MQQTSAGIEALMLQICGTRPPGPKGHQEMVTLDQKDLKSFASIPSDLAIKIYYCLYEETICLYSPEVSVIQGI